MAKFYGISAILQLLMVVIGHFIGAVANLFPILGTAIPLGIGGWFGATAGGSYGRAAAHGFFIGGIPALIGVVISILLQDVPWSTITFAPASSAVAGLIGAVVMFAVKGKQSATS